MNTNEIARYLGYRDCPLPPEIAEMAADCMRELERRAAPREIGRRLFVRDLNAGSRDLARHLRHCEEAELFAITLGAEADRLLRRWSVGSMAKAAVGQACCAVILDELCDAYCTRLLARIPEGKYLTPPFSPGYGDWALSEQGKVLKLLDAHRRIGLTLTEGGMLVPEKSITAVAGISSREEEGCGQKCLRCKKTDCPFRKGG